MHIWQAIKMACKSLWTNKLRSALTMLGIIIGVMTVALLTSVASGVQASVISSIRTQSTLSIIMNTSGRMSYSSVTSILDNKQPEETEDDYYKYSIIKNTNSVVSVDLTGVTQEEFQDDYGSYLNLEVLKSYSNEEILKLQQENKKEELMFALMHNARKKSRPLQSSVYAVDKNFLDVYDLEFEGAFPSKNNEILVDKDFIEAYLNNCSASDAIGQTISLGVTYFDKISIKFTRQLLETEITDICKYLQGQYKTGEDEQGNDIKIGLGMTIIANADKSLYVYDTDNNTLVVNTTFSQNIKNEDRVIQLKQKLQVDLPEIFALIGTNENDVQVKDIYDLSNVKTYTICGVLDDKATMFTGMGSGDSGMMNSMVSLMMSNQKGTCYMLLDNSNLAPLGEKVSNISDISISYAYLRYKTEDVMADSTTDLSVAFMVDGGYGYMADFMVISMSSVANIVDSVMDTLTTMLTVISIVSLIVGGIGIMNIMLVAVTERTREIGIRKAIGAKRGSILTQFLVEALMLAIIGGAIGLGISAIGCAIIGHFIGFTITVPLWVVGMSVGFCTLIGLAFGMFPAIKASHMQPIDALRRD